MDSGCVITQCAADERAGNARAFFAADTGGARLATADLNVTPAARQSRGRKGLPGNAAAISCLSPHDTHFRIYRRHSRQVIPCEMPD
jgi:hypothetical protein